MLAQLARVARVARPRHLLKLLVAPRAEIAAFRYHFRRVPERAFVAFLAEVPPSEQGRVDAVYRDLEGHAPLFARLRTKLDVHPDGFGGQMMAEYSAVYAIVRCYARKSWSRPASPTAPPPPTSCARSKTTGVATCIPSIYRRSDFHGAKRPAG